MNSKIISLLIVSAAIFCVICPAQADGQITITASGDRSYYSDEMITFSGTNTGSDSVYLFIAGPNLNENGSKPDDPGTAAETGNVDTFSRATVADNDTWKYELFNTTDFEPGTYTVFAVTEPNNMEDLSKGTYDSVSIAIKRPFITVQVSEPVVQRGEELVITGNASWMPHSVAIWVMGFNYWNGAENGSMVTVIPEDDGSYSYVLDRNETAKMKDGKYYVIAQHPMYNDEFNVITEDDPSGNGVLVTGIRTGPPEENGPGFYIGGNFALRGADAAEALIEEIDSADIDDTYDKCEFEIKGQVENS